MSDDGTRITIRMGLEEIQMMEDFMSDHEIENRSDFVRDAVRAYIDLVRSGRPVQQESGIFVRFSELQLSALSGLVSLGVSLDEEEFVRKCVLDKILPKAVEEEAYENAFRAAQRNAALKRRIKGWDNRRLPGRMGTAKAETGECATWKPFKKDLWGCKRWHTTTDRRMRTSRRSRS
jgi:Arc/MetJ-type ribon-helix-helix transcriptional regulator